MEAATYELYTLFLILLLLSSISISRAFVISSNFLAQPNYSSSSLALTHKTLTFKSTAKVKDIQVALLCG